MTSQVFVLPDLGEGLLEAELVHWLVKVGDAIAIDAPVAEVETAKALVEIPSPYGGVVAALHADEGTTVRVGAPLISVTAELPSAAATYLEEERAGSGNVLVGYGTTAVNGNGHGRRRRRPTRVVPASGPTERPRAMSPIVRKLARDRGLDLAAVPGTGPDGLITRTDVERAPAPDLRPPTPTGTDGRTGLPIGRRIPLQGTRKAIAGALARSRREIPEATIWADVDATALLRLRAELNTAGDGPGLLALVARFVLAGLARFPALNARVDTESEQILHLAGVNLGIATQTDRGLTVPAVRNAELMTARVLDGEIRRVTTAARDGSATAAELGCGSFTLNNYGRFGVDGSAAIINHPEVAILGMGRIMARPWVVDGAIVARSITQLSLVFDHRVCDGETSAGFLRFVADAMESPVSVLADL
ncbi:MAG: dihydrolipoamide acetyltransferase family protein [Labedaea sp.]